MFIGIVFIFSAAPKHSKHVLHVRGMSCHIFQVVGVEILLQSCISCPLLDISLKTLVLAIRHRQARTKGVCIFSMFWHIHTSLCEYNWDTYGPHLTCTSMKKNNIPKFCLVVQGDLWDLTVSRVTIKRNLIRSIKQSISSDFSNNEKKGKVLQNFEIFGGAASWHMVHRFFQLWNRF